ncbi:NAD(P)/FAD-dependent oxidoreductase [Uliginosibacterium sp. H3]|uniref:NAD(P)/FAD-dependent oxidoreductase n=1 Tax=Uliginosibacterium silvisoli TaxID=3114758 RepID=A0ABU6K250_9RHOO|nr:NAD(P)/FAD-dependent oxidoreductase [Uliginosibacterium sp. H3]
MSKTALIIGAGPAGLTAAFEILSQKTGIQPIVLEATDRIGGISCTIEHNGNRIDIGGHRFFSKSDTVMDWWAARMPLQGSPSSDDIILGSKKPWAAGGPDPQKVDRVMLIRERISRIFYLRKFFDYPISMKLETVTNLGIFRTAWAGLGYVASQMFKRKDESSLEDFLVNRFGVPLYRMFFEDYTEKVWGAHPRRISAAWGAQRIKGLSLSKAVFSALKKMLPGKKDTDLRQKKTETSLIEQFFYPKLGPGQLWEFVADDVRKMGGDIRMRHKVIGIHIENGRVAAVTAECDGVQTRIECDYCFSTMPIKDFVAAAQGDTVPEDVKRIARDLPYRDFMTVGVLANKLKIRNTTNIKTVGNIVPDTWIYIQERDVKLCRLQIFNNWSPYMVKDPVNTTWVGLEYMCDEKDDIWKMSDADFIEFAVKELVKIDIVDRADILDTCRIRIEKAYPAYFGTYDEFDTVKAYLDSVDNLFCIGRNGQHRYNNQDHSMLTAIESVRCMIDPGVPRSTLWSINTEQEYHETKKS